MKPKLAYVTYHYPYLGGYANRAIGHIRYLSERFDVHLFYCMRKGAGEDLDLSKLVRKETCLLKNPEGSVPTADFADGTAFSRLGIRGLARIAGNVIFRNIPLYVSTYHSEEARREFELHAAGGAFDCIWAYSAMGGGIACNAGERIKVLDLCDSGGALFDSFYRCETNHVLKAVFWLERWESERYEKGLAAKFGTTAFVCRSDMEKSGIDISRCTVLPNFRERRMFLRGKRQAADIVMAGRWDYYPNRLSLQRALGSILPRLWAKYKVRIIGAGASAAQIRAMGKIYRGNVEDYHGFLAGCKLSIAPILCGAGLQTKVIDALEAGLPVLASPHAKESVDPDSECSAIIRCELPEEYAFNASRLLGNPARLRLLSFEARKFFEERFMLSGKECRKEIASAIKLGREGGAE